MIGNDSSLQEKLHSAVADLILITGDFITDGRYIDSAVDYLGGLSARDGVYAILGNHDYYFLTMMQHFRHYVFGKPYVSNEWRRLVTLLDGAGIRVLINEYVTVKTEAGSTLFVEGTDDPVRGTPRITDADSEYERSSLKILMSHSPDILYSDELRKKKFDILLSGHTHGGQIRLPGVGPIVTGTKRASRRESYGMFRTADGMVVNVSAGIGHTLLPIRVNCPPEIVMIEFTGN
jgi:hypothetical protein